VDIDDVVGLTMAITLVLEDQSIGDKLLGAAYNEYQNKYTRQVIVKA